MQAIGLLKLQVGKRGPTEIRTRVAGFKVLSANHYTMGPTTRILLSATLITKQNVAPGDAS